MGKYKCLFLISELAPRVFYKLRNLKTLDLSENHLQFLSGAVFADVPNLETLICESCGVFQVFYLQIALIMNVMITLD